MRASGKQTDRERDREKDSNSNRTGRGREIWPGSGRANVVVVLQSLLLLFVLLYVLYLNYELLQTDKIISIAHSVSVSFSLFSHSRCLFSSLNVTQSAEATVFHLFMSEFRSWDGFNGSGQRLERRLITTNNSQTEINLCAS